MFDVKKEAAVLVKQMTLEEKVSQMLHGASQIKHLNIPSYNWWNEALHGVARAGLATVFPQAIGMAATFSEELIFQVADKISTEGRAKFHAFQEECDHDIFKGITFWSPNINIFRDPRWGRGHETYGEDPYLTSRLGIAFIRGLQGPDKNSLKAAACAKHFAVHSGPESERHEFNAICDDYDLWNTYLPAFEAAVKEGQVEAVMGAYNRTLGEPCCGSKLLLKDILRDKWEFDGHVVSDCWAIKDFHENHRVTQGPVESVTLAVQNGCDVNCGNIFGYCLQAVKEGLLTEEQIDQAVIRLFTSRMRLGLLGAPENPKYVSIPYSVVDCDEHRELNLEVARRSLILLKNDGSLPLNTKQYKTVGVIGPNADSRRALEGNYQGTSSHYITPLRGIADLLEPQGIRVMYAQGCHLYKDKSHVLGIPDDRMAEAITVAKESDAIIICLGLDADIEGEQGDMGNQFAGGDKPGLELPGRQQALLEKVFAAANGKPVILVLISGSALAVNWADEHINGIIQAFYPGAYGGRAIVEAIFGYFSPSGKLPVTFYRNDEDIPDFRDYNMAGRTYRYFTEKPLYPFGFGLSYTTFQLRDFFVSKESCRVTVKNTGNMAARETVQIYVKSPGQREQWNLCAMAGTFLEPGGEQELEMKLWENTFSRFDNQGNSQIINGPHTLYAGFSQPDAYSVNLYGQAPLEQEIII